MPFPNVSVTELLQCDTFGRPNHRQHTRLRMLCAYGFLFYFDHMRVIKLGLVMVKSFEIIFTCSEKIIIIFLFKTVLQQWVTENEEILRGLS